MPGDNFSRRVARAAAVGGGRTYRAETPVTWFAIVLVICLVGVGLVAYSRYERLHPQAAAVKPAVPPTAKNEWQVAMAVDICGALKPSALPASAAAQSPYNITSNGLVDIQPQRALLPSAYEGTRATLGSFLGSEAVLLSTGHLQIPGKPVPVPTTSTTTTTTRAGSTTTTTKAGSTTTTTRAGSTTTSTSATSTTTTVPTRPGKPLAYHDGQHCGSQVGVVEVAVWASPSARSPRIVTTNPQDLRFANGQLITIAFVPKGTVPAKPPASARKAVSDFLITNPNGVAPVTTPTSTPSLSVPTSSSSTTSTAGSGSSSTSTTGSGSSTSTTKASG